jgi:hypothetical protein
MLNGNSDLAKNKQSPKVQKTVKRWPIYLALKQRISSKV